MKSGNPAKFGAGFNAMGYYQVYDNFNIGKKSEFNERHWIEEGDVTKEPG